MMTTRRGDPLGDVVSAMQKAIRRGDPRLAGYFALELAYANFDTYCWRRLTICAAEDCWGALHGAFEALQAAYWRVKSEEKKPVERSSCRLLLTKAVLLLAQAKKCRDADHLLCFLYEGQQAHADELAAAILEAHADPEHLPELPEYAYDCHTARGKRAGKPRQHFFRDECEALEPRQPGFFDDRVPPRPEP
jgi:replication-associated recombination protein RarA